ncbi:serine hydrolase domain-containing protein [Actinophytocola sp.]|uniref:serine hydrolase domain-containing protein n=1 Tax=Actinophytocola sp. TaxID=1872138 RepID=UPI002ED28795
MKLGLFLAIASLLFACTPAPVAAADPLTEYLEQAVRAKRFRGAVEVRRGDEVVLRRGFGQADLRDETPNRPDTRFRVASVTKQFTALAVLLLQEQNKLRVTDPVCTHLPACPPHWQPITIEHLLTHTSGLHDYADVMQEDLHQFYRDVGSQPSPERLIQTFADRPLDFSPGAGLAYSNSGYVVLGQLVERVSGESYGDFLRREILDPLGMSDTGYAPGRAAGRDAAGYENWTTPAAAFDDSVFFSSGGLTSTVTDLGRWQQFLLTGEPAICEPETLAELLLPRVAEGTTRWYGYGIESTGSSTTEIDGYFHSGSIPGFSSYVEVRPKGDLTVALAANMELDAHTFGRDLVRLASR